MAEQVKVGCTQKDCSVALTNRCLNGFEVEDCPHYISDLSAAPAIKDQQPDMSAILDNETLTNELSASFVRIPYGEDLDVTSARRIMRNARTNVIVLAGDVNSGKTTILAAIYERFIDGIFAGYMFSGSETLPGFERRCHPSRITSEESRPDTDRTPRGDTKLLHLRLQKVGNVVGSRDLLFSDISGEDFEAARDSVDICKQMLILRRADRCLLLVDGEELSDLKNWHRAAKAAEMLLRSFLDANMVDLRSRIDVLVTKYDKVVTHPDRNRIETFIDKVSQDMTTKFSSRLASLRLRRVAARPEDPEVLRPAFGLDEILTACVEESSSWPKRNIDTLLHRSTGREFDRYLERRLPGFIRTE